MIKDKKGFVLTEMILLVSVIILALVMLLGKHEKTLDKVSVILQNAEDSQWNALKYGLKMAAEEYDIELVVVDMEEGASSKVQKELMKSELEEGTDALIVQPAFDSDARKMLEEMNQKVPVMLVDHAAGESAEKSRPAVTEPDNYEMGQALAKEVLKDFDGNIAGKKVGILSQEWKSEALSSREKGVKEVLRERGAEILEVTAESICQGAMQTDVDIVIALDDKSLTSVGAHFAGNQSQRELLYGVGYSTESVYYLDTGIAECVVVPDEFNVGYQSLSEIAEKLNDFFGKIESQKVSYTMMRKENLFTKKNQEILLTMSE